MMQFLLIISSAVLGLKFGKIDILLMKRTSSTARAYPTYLCSHHQPESLPPDTGHAMCEGRIANCTTSDADPVGRDRAKG